ncbi:MAG: hypothetical protein A2Z18_01445 [Armatimonadetes bacterium RBG_16_58_9]|nr:MAG: hypothetical protein A2Z18_01445 [Armatimonadetes bacterium RBG_16_58_9]
MSEIVGPDVLTKTDQTGERRWVAIPHGINQDTCPVAALQGWLEVSGISEGAVFSGLDRHGNIISARIS